MSGIGPELAIKRLSWRVWRVYEIHESPTYGRYAKVLRDELDRIRNFISEYDARGYIESVPDATETEYPA